MPPVELTLIGKPDCHLCEDAEAVVAEVVAQLPAGSVRVTAHSILDDETLRARYWEDIPVVLIDGERHTYWRVDPARLRAALEEAGARPGRVGDGRGRQ